MGRNALLPRRMGRRFNHPLPPQEHIIPNSSAYPINRFHPQPTQALGVPMAPLEFLGKAATMLGVAPPGPAGLSIEAFLAEGKGKEAGTWNGMGQAWIDWNGGRNALFD